MTAWMLVLQNLEVPSWMEEYLREVPPMIARHGGRRIGVSQRVIALEDQLSGGQPPAMNLVAVFEFPSRQDIEDFMNAPDYQPQANARKLGSKSDIYILDDMVL